MIFATFGVAINPSDLRPISEAELNRMFVEQAPQSRNAGFSERTLRDMANYRPYPDPPPRPLDERFADFKARLSAAMKRHGIAEEPFISAPQPKATTAVQSCLPRSAVVANQSRGRSEGRAGYANADSQRGQNAAGTAGIKPGPREAIPDPVSFNAALSAHGGARDQTILTSGASQGTQSGRALDAGRGSAASTGVVGCDVSGFTPASSAAVALSLLLALLLSAPLVCIEIIRLCA